MTWRFCTLIVLVSVCITPTGCSKRQAKPDAGDGPSEAVAKHPSVRERVEPSIQYVSLPADTDTTQAVVVEGYPLLHTRQLLPLNPEGTLVGEGATDQQIQQVLTNLEAVLAASGSALDKLVRLNIYADSPETVEQVRQQLKSRLATLAPPAITAVVTPLSHPSARVAVDAVAIAASQGDSVALLQCDAVHQVEGCADAAVMPRGGVVYLSGQPDKTPLPDSASHSLTALLKLVDQLQLTRAEVTHLKVFVQPATAADEVLGEVKKHFPNQLTPPITFVEWIASAPVEIEMVVHFPLPNDAPADSVRYYTPPGVKASPTFSRVAIVETERQIFIAGLSARESGDAESQVRDVLAQLQDILAQTDSDILHLAKATYYVSDDAASKILGPVRLEHYDPQRPPAASLAKVHGVALPDRSVTIDMIATPK